MSSFTNFLRDDGFAAQYQTIIFSILWCELTGNKFKYSPFNTIAHNYDNDPLFVEKKEKLINIRDGYDLADDGTIRLGSYIYSEVEYNLDRCLAGEEIKKIKQLFWAGKSKIYDKPKNLAVHIRAVNKEDIGSYGYVDHSYFVEKIKDVLVKHPTANIHIYSQGRIGNFEQFLQFNNANNIYFHLNDSVEFTFQGLVEADYLIMSKSSFSYCAALLSEGEIYYLPFWHRPATFWG